MDKLIIELVEDCKLVRRGSEPNGHDCWGNYEFTTYKYVMIDGKEQHCWDGWYVVHDGEKVREIITKNCLELKKYLLQREEKMRQHELDTGFKTPEEYKAYLIGKNEKKD